MKAPMEQENVKPLLQVFIPPRFIRLRDAPRYLGMDKNRFNSEVRPGVAAIPIGRQGVAFDRVDLDAWADDYKRQFARLPPPATLSAPRRPYTRAFHRVASVGEDKAAFVRALAAPKTARRNQIR